MMVLILRYCTPGGGNMGFFGGDSQSEADKLVSEQFKQNQMELEEKRKKLYQERLDIIKSQGQQQWHPRKDVPL